MFGGILSSGMHVAGLQGDSGIISRVDLYQIMCAWGGGGEGREWNLMPKPGFRVYPPAVKSHQMLAILKYG